MVPRVYDFFDNGRKGQCNDCRVVLAFMRNRRQILEYLFILLRISRTMRAAADFCTKVGSDAYLSTRNVRRRLPRRSLFKGKI